MQIKKININKTYYKVLNKNEQHYGLKYKIGMNIDILPFDDNPRHCCCKGRIYFTTLENLPLFFGYGCWIRPVTITKDAKVIIDPTGDKIGADKVILGKRISVKQYFDTLFDPDKFEWRYHSDHLALYASKYFDKWFDPEKFNYYHHSYTLPMYCSKHFTKWFYPNKFNWEQSWALEKYCLKYKHIWIKHNK